MPTEKEVTIFSELVDRYGRLWIGESVFKSTIDGTIDPSIQQPVSAEWSDVDGSGPFWSLYRKTKRGAHEIPGDGKSERISFTAIVDGRPLVTTAIERDHRASGVREIKIENEEIVGRVFAPLGDSALPGIIVVPGSGGGIPVGTAEHLASQGYVVLALAYFGEADLTKDLEMVPLEYMDRAVDWFKQLPIVDQDRVGFLGGSKGGELALLVASRRKDLRAIVAVVPSTYVFQSISDQWRKTSSWSVNGIGLPFVPYAASSKFRLSGILKDLYEDSLKFATEEHRIQLENVSADVLLITGSDDMTWPLNSMCRDAIKRLKLAGKGQNFQQLNYEDVGHEVFSPGYRPVSWSTKVGGSRQGQANAQAQSWTQTLEFLKQNLFVEDDNRQPSTNDSHVQHDKQLNVLSQLDQLIRTKHVRPFWLQSQNDYEAIVSRAKTSLARNNLTPEQRHVELLKVLAAVRDGHSGMAYSSRDRLFGYIPLTTEWFGDELRIVKTSSEYQNTLGAKIISVEGTSLADLKTQLQTVVPHTNLQRFIKISPSYLQLPGLLYGLGVTSSPDQAKFAIQLPTGEQQEVVFRRMNDEQYEKATFVTYDKTAKSLPLYRQRTDESYWYEYLPDEKLFYLMYNRITSDDDKSIWTWAPQMWAKVDSLDVEKFVIDIRNNGGGGFQFSLPIIQGVLDRPKLNQRGKLFVLTGYKTFSAAIGFLEQLENRSNAIIVGVPPSDHPASPGDSDEFSLGETGIKVNLSQIFHSTIFPDDQRRSVGLDQQIPTSWADLCGWKRSVVGVRKTIRCTRNETNAR